MKLSQSNFNSRWPDCYLVRSYLIATVKELFLQYCLYSGILASLYPYLSSAKKKSKNGVFPSKLGSKFGFLCPIDSFFVVFT